MIRDVLAAAITDTVNRIISEASQLDVKTPTPMEVRQLITDHIAGALPAVYEVPDIEVYGTQESIQKIASCLAERDQAQAQSRQLQARLLDMMRAMAFQAQAQALIFGAPDAQPR